ncbi:MAG: hypothetical protein OER88_04315 [Planctomycetota bacterium]|nr:hypothetical protein [Planctomycetota bacterium]
MRRAVLVLAAAFAAAADEPVVHVEVASEDVTFQGTLVTPNLVVKTRYGTLHVPATELRRLVRSESLLVLETRTDRVAGVLEDTVVAVKTKHSVRQVHAAEIVRLVARRGMGAPVRTGRFVLLKDGSRLRIEGSASSLHLATAYGKLEIPLTRVERVEPVDGGVDIVSGGMRLRGRLADEPVSIRTRHGALRIPSTAVRRILWGLAPRAGDTLAGGSRVVAAGVLRGHTYLVVQHETGKSWDEAAAVAKRTGGVLACIGGAEENEFVVNLAQRHGRTAWIGLSDAERESNWVWASGENVAYTNWDPGEPNNVGQGGEDYAEIYLYGPRRGRWNDTEPARRLGLFVIELPY